MKNTIVTLLFCLIALTGFSQSSALVDTVYDKDGRKFPVNQIKINLDGIYGSEHFVAATSTCSSGYFNVFFANGSGMEGSATPTLNTLHLQRRAVVCEVLANISGMINPSFNSATAKVNILVDDIALPQYGYPSPSTSGVIGAATPFYAFPNSVLNSNPGIADNAIYKTIITQQDGYTNVPSNAVFTNSNYYHGLMIFNFYNTALNFNVNLGSAAAFNQIDFYSVVLHEMTHALGFLSLINSNGMSKFGATNNYYSRYDPFLKDKNNAYLLTSMSGCSNQYGLTFTSSTLNLAPNCPNPSSYTPNSTTCGTANYYTSASLPKVPVYTSDCWEGGSSLSHFEDQCYPIPGPAYGNDAYFLMCNASGPGVTKRHLVEEERKVLCDLGYSPINTYTSNAVSAPFTYTSSSCNNVDVVGMNDGFVGPSTYTINTNVLTPVTISNILANDVNSSNVTAVAYKCLQTIVGTGTLSTTSGSGPFTYTPQGSGVHVLRYIPLNAFNKEGNITYIYVNVTIPTGTCSIPVNNPCNLVFNGDFENYSSLPVSFLSTNGITLTCGWKDASGSCDYFNGLSSTSVFGVPCNMAGWESDNVPGKFGYGGFVNTRLPNGNPAYMESMYTQLTSALLPGTAYNLSFDVSLGEGKSSYALPMQAYLATNTTFTNTTNLGITLGPGILLQAPTSVTNTNGWTPVSMNFTTTGGGEQYLALGFLTTLTGSSLTPVPTSFSSCVTNFPIFNDGAYVYIDNVKLIPAAYVATLNLPASVCATQSVNLTPLATPSTGVFNGLGVSCTGTNCAFNVTSTGLGPHYISYSLAASSGTTCPYFGNGIINVSNFSVTAAMLNTLCLNLGQSATLIATPNTTTSTNYTWMPGSGTGSNVVVTPTATTVYTVSATNGGCVVTNTVLVPVKNSNPISFTGTPQICSGSYSSLIYLESFLGAGSPPGGLFSGPGIVMQSCPSGICSYISTYPASSYPPGMYTYTYNASILGCNYSKTISVQVLPTANFTISALNNSNCLSPGQTATLTAINNQTPALTYSWNPGALTGSMVTVTPSTTTVYTVTVSNGACSSIKLFTVFVNTPPSINFTNTPSTWCSAQSIYYLENYLATGTPTGGTWSGYGGIYTASVGATAVYINPTTPVGTYTITYNYTIPNTTCNYSNSFTVNIVQGFVLNTNGLSTYCSNIGVGAVISATATPSSGVTFTWSPGSLTGATQTVTPGSPTVYTVVASNAQCSFSNVVSVNISTTCCQATNYMSGAPATGSYTGSWAINQNVTINSPVTFDNAEFKIAKDVTITIASGGTLTLQYCHLYSCGDMWSGIIVNNGGQVMCPGQVWNPNQGQVFDDNRVLIEDAKIAVSMNNCTNTSNSINDYNIVMQNAVFNKNHIGISYKNYNYTTRAPIDVNNCVFSCRTLTFNATTWPAPTLTVNGLRYSPASTPTAGFASPYDLQSAAYVNLKAPYSTITSSTGILFDNVGAFGGSTFFGAEIGNETSEDYFNLFDGQAYSIDATNSNLRSVNNAFQNSKRYTIVICGSKCATYTVGGTAIRQTINTTMNANLNLNAIGSGSASTSFGNRFWNCYAGVEAYNTYRFNMERAIFRSLQTTSGGTGYLPGNTGVYINTNRFQYNMRFNEFANICNAINIPIVAGTYNIGSGTVTGIYAANLVINNNYFGANYANSGPLGGKYVSSAVSVTSPNGTTWQFANSTGLFAQNNTMYRVYRGIQVSGLAGYSCTINNNYISLNDDNLFSAQQRGIEVTSTQNKAVVSTNTLTTVNMSNTLIALCYFGANTGTNSPRVTCNDLSNSYKAFEFNATNKGTYWRGNLMNGHIQGLTLSNSATISVQGGSGNPQDNAWNGTWTSGTNFGTYMDNSDATKSPIWYKSGSAPPTPTGNVVLGQHYGAPNTLSLTTGAYSCAGGGARMASQKNNEEENENSLSIGYKGNNASVSESEYVNGTSLYRFLSAYPSEKTNNAIYSSFYNAKLNTSMDQFVQIEKALYDQQFGQALSLNNAVITTNPIEANYKSFYNIYIKVHTGTFTSADSTSLATLSNFCPGLDGEVVYQARALYNSIYKTVIVYNENCNPLSQDNLKKSTINKIDKENSWMIELYPNPANTFVNIVSSNEKDQLRITVIDVNGRILFVKQVITSNFICKLDLDLLPGAYFVTITNDKNNSTNKKLIIAK